MSPRSHPTSPASLSPLQPWPHPLPSLSSPTMTASRRAPAPPAVPSRLRRTLRRAAIPVAGTAVVAAGIAMLVLPGPGLVTIALGLSLLGREHAWAAALEQRIRARLAAAARRVRRPTVTALPPAATLAVLDDELEEAA